MAQMSKVNERHFTPGSVQTADDWQNRFTPML